jgi:hypothetical protein
MLKDKQILYAAQIANTIFAGPTIGSPSPPSYRSLVSADINSFSHVQNGNTYGTNSIIGTIDNFNINFITNNITRVIISNIGNVGIGTNTLTEKFNINGYSLATGYKTPSGLSTGFLKADGSIDSTSYLSLAPTLQQVLTNGNVADKELIIQRSVNNAEAITVADFNGAAKIKLYADTNGGYTAFTNDSQSTSIILNGYTGSGTYGVNGEILIDPNSSLIVLDSTLSNSIFKVDRVNDVVNINGTFYSTSLDNGSFLGVRDGDSYLGWQNKGNPQTVGEIHFNSTKSEYFYEKTDNSSGLLAGGRVNIDLTLMLIKHLTKISLSSPLMEVSQNPTTTLGIATKQYVDASASSLTLQQVTTNGNTTTNQIIVPSVKSPIDASKILFYVGGPTITSSDSYNQSVTDNSGSRIIYDNGSIFGQVKANLNQIEVYHDTQIIATSPIFTWNGNTIETQNNKATTFSVVNNTLYPTVQAAYNADEAILASANNYTDNLVNGLSWKKSVLYSTTTSENLSLTGLTATIDGTSRTLLTTDRILVKNQTTASQNGIYNPSTTSWTRVTDANTNTTILSATVYVRDGSAEKNRVYAVNVSPITIGTTSITFALISGTGTYTYGSYLKLTGNVFDIDFTTFTSNNVIEGGSNLYFTNSRGISATLTGYISGVGVISSTDSILQAIQKLNGNINALPTPVTSVTGTLNRITSTVGTTPIIDISSNYIGQSTITTLGIITTGTWNGTQIADVYLASASNWNSKQTGSTNLTSLSALTFVSTSFVKMSATGTFVLDTNTYLTSNQTITLSGDVTGTGTTSITTSILSTTVTNKVLTGYVSGAGTISATDSILQAIQKLNGNISSLVTGVSSVNTLTGVVVLTTANISDSLNKRYVTDANLVVIGNTSNTNSGDNAINSLYSGLATSKENAITGTTSVDFWSGAKTFINFATTVRSTVLTGLSNATSQVIASTDSVLLALGYLQGQINVNITSIATKQSTLVSGTNIRTVNGSTLLGNTDLQVGTILGSLPATAGLIPFASGTANTITTDPNFKFTSASGLLSYGGAFTGQSLPANRLNIDQTGTSGTSINVYNTTTTAFSSLLFEQTGTQFGGFFRYNSGYVGNYTGTSLAFADSFQIQSGNANNKPFIISVTPFVIQCGVSSTNLASRNDAVGYRIDTLSSIHTTNLNPFTVNGKSYLGGNSTATAVVHIAAGTATAGTAPIKLTAGTNLTVIENGTIEYDGTNYFMSASNIRNKIGTELTISSGLTRATNTITNDLITGLAGGQTIIGGTGASENLTLSSTSNATKGFINIVDTTKITNTSGGVLSNAGGNSGYLNIVGSTANNTNYPNISFIGGTTTLANMPYISSQNAGNAIEMFAGGSKLYLDGNNGLIYYNQVLGTVIPFVVDINRNTRIDRNNVLYNPTNYANLTIGAATQNGYVSLVINEGTLNVVPGVIPSGGMYNEGGRLWFREGSTLNKALVGAIYTQTSSVSVTNTVTETSVLNSTITLPANTLNIGKTIRFKLSGLHSAVSSPTIRIKVKLGTTIILDTTAVTTSNLTNGLVVIEGDITCRTTGTSGSVYGQGLYNEYGTTNNFNQMINTGATTINTTTSQVLDVTVTWGTASVSDSLTITNGCVEIIN